MAEELSRGNLKMWINQGVILHSDDGGAVSPSDLLEFAQYVMQHFPDSKVQVHCNGLRATKVEGAVGPGLDWKGWS